MIMILKEVKSEVNNNTYVVKELKLDNLKRVWNLEVKEEDRYRLIRSFNDYGTLLNNLNLCLTQKLS